jgi:hypothetical protein
MFFLTFWLDPKSSKKVKAAHKWLKIFLSRAKQQVTVVSAVYCQLTTDWLNRYLE